MTILTATSPHQLNRKWFALFLTVQVALIATVIFAPAGFIVPVLAGVGGAVFLVLYGLFPWIIVPAIIATTALDITGRLVKETAIGIPLTGFHAAIGIMLLGLAMNTFLKRRMTFPEFELKGPLFLLLGVMALSLTYTPNLAEATIGVMRTLILIVFLYAAQVMIDSRRAVNLVIISIALALVGAAILAIVQIRTESFFLPASFVVAVGANAPRAVGTFHNPNTFGTFMMCGTIFLFGILFFCPLSMRNRILVLLPMAIGAIGLVVTFSRSNWVAAMVGITVVLAMARKLRYLFYVGFSSVVVILAIKEFVPFADHIFERFLSIFTILEDFGNLGRESSSARIYFIIAGLDMWLDHPVLGAGWRAFPVLFDFYKPVDFPFWVPTKESHTLAANMLAELGLVGFFASAWVVWRTLDRGWRGFTTIRDPYLKGILGALLTLFISFQVSLSFTADFSNNFLWFFTGMIFSVIALGRQADADEEPVGAEGEM